MAALHTGPGATTEIHRVRRPPRTMGRILPSALPPSAASWLGCSLIDDFNNDNGVV